jgi:hypothetical protein
MGVYRGRSRSATVGWEPEEIFSDMVNEKKRKIMKKQDVQNKAARIAAFVL